MMHSVTLLTGSNDRLAIAILLQAAELLEERLGKPVEQSNIYPSEAWGFVSEFPFYNQALRFETDLAPLGVLDMVQEVEYMLGRCREDEAAERERTGAAYASRIIDVDIIFYDNEVICSERLTIPHPLLTEREFALRPLCEIMGEFRHPALGTSLNDLLKRIEKVC